ncbi:RNA polymerase subunit sigma-70 [Streptomyces sp. NPDC026672]|uniref:RNA polymerase subunit sigma-70 n=1 Tax=unclassified Streptomyces TaxID=2593676 RepID=UPI0034004DA6
MRDAELLGRARAGDGEAFAELTEPYRRELLAHCYRMLASAQDAEDAVQETMLAAWQGLGSFQERASLRTWLYRIATNRCLNALRSAKRRPAMHETHAHDDAQEPPRISEVTWLEPYPDLLLEAVADHEPGPEARYEATEAISLAFITALQLLPPRQRAALILCDVVGHRAGEVADMLGTTYGAVASALKHARATMARHAAEVGDEPPPTPHTPAERDLIDKLTSAYAAADLDSLLALLADDIRLTMPPHPFEYHGRAFAARGIGQLFAQGHQYRLIETRANGQPAFALYRKDPHAGILHANGLLVVTLAGTHISALTMFTASVLGRFGLPRTLPA